MVGWLVVLRIYVASVVFQPYRDLEAGDNQSLKIQVARPGIESGHFVTQILDPPMTNMEHITYTIIKRCTCSESHVYYVLTFQCKTPPFCYIKGIEQPTSKYLPKQYIKINSLKIKINEQLTIEQYLFI